MARFIALALELWCKERGIELHFIRKGKPTENGFIERFNCTYREEVLDANFETLQQVRAETNCRILGVQQRATA